MKMCVNCFREIDSEEDCIESHGCYICNQCKYQVSSQVSQYLLQSTKILSPVVIKCFLDESLTGLSDFLEELKDITED